MIADPTYPNFENPPVVEVALAVQFQRLPGFRYTHYGKLWERFADRFPHVEDHGPLDQKVETFGVPEIPRLGVQLVSGDLAPIVRSWFMNEDRTELLQVQPDRVIHNWRKVGVEVREQIPYPRYEHIREQFESELGDVCKFIQEFELGDFLPNQCEITYINHIVAGDGWEVHSDIDRIISFITTDCKTAGSLPMENTRFDARYIISDSENSPVGRLHISFQPAFRKSDEKPMFILTLTARGRPEEVSGGAVMRFLDKGRELIVNAFTEVTSSHMHAVWRKK